MYEASSHDPNILNVDKRNIFIGALVLLILAAGLFLAGLKLEVFAYYPFFLLIPIIYTISGAIGIWVSCNSSSIRIIFYQLTLVVLMAFNFITAVISLVVEIFLLLNPEECDPKTTEDCGFIGGIAILIMIMIAASALVSAGLTILIYVFWRQVIRYKNDIVDYELGRF